VPGIAGKVYGALHPNPLENAIFACPQIDTPVGGSKRSLVWFVVSSQHQQQQNEEKNEIIIVEQ
jgi:hypothetical protein